VCRIHDYAIAEQASIGDNDAPTTVCFDEGRQKAHAGGDQAKQQKHDERNHDPGQPLREVQT
jgi:hypothetical protein